MIGGNEYEYNVKFCKKSPIIIAILTIIGIVIIFNL